MSLKPDVRVRMRFGTRKDVECEGEKGIACKNGAALVECLVRGWAAASQIIVIHGREVVVRQRVAMHAFHRCARHQRILSRHIEQRRAFHDQERSQTFAAAEARIAHRVKQSLGPCALAVDGARREQAVEQRFRVAVT